VAQDLWNGDEHGHPVDPSGIWKRFAFLHFVVLYAAASLSKRINSTLTGVESSFQFRRSSYTDALRCYLCIRMLIEMSSLSICGEDSDGERCQRIIEWKTVPFSRNCCWLQLDVCHWRIRWCLGCDRALTLWYFNSEYIRRGGRVGILGVSAHSATVRCRVKNRIVVK